MRIQNKLIIILYIFSFIPFLGLGIIGITVDRGKLKKQIGDSSLEYSRSVMRHINQFLHTKYLNIQGWTKNMCFNEITSGDKYGNISRFLAGLANLHEDYYYINCLNTDGQVVASNNADLIGRDMSTNVEFKEALNGNVTMQDVAFDETAGGYAIVMSTPVWNISDQYEINGVLTAAIKWDMVNDMITGLRIKGRRQTLANHFMLTNQDGLVISCFDTNDVFKVNLIEYGMKSALHVQEDKEGYIVETTEHNNISFCTYTYLKEYKDLPQLHWNLILIRDAKEVFDIISSSGKRMTYILLITFPVFGIIAILFARHITKPICAVVSAARDIGNGDLNTTVSIKSNDEIGQLAVSFNQMVEGLKKYNIALNESEEKFRSISSAANDAIIMMDNDGRVTYWNKAAARMFGFSEVEVNGAKLYEKIIPVGLRADYIKRFNNFRDTGQGKVIGETVEMTAINKGGTEFPVEISVSSVKIDDKWNTVGIARDITERKQAEVQRKKDVEKLKTALNGIVNTLALTAEQRDPYTAGHQRRVSKLASSIAEEMGLSEHQVEGIRMAGIVHDIGKMHIPAEILSRPGKLTQDEYNIVKTHAQVSYDILKGTEFPWPLADIVHQHHEKMDGSGYPLGLSNGDILMEARILCVADIVEAMTSHRPYRPALGLDKALEEISKGRDIHYDSDVVDACLKLVKEKWFRFEPLE